MNRAVVPALRIDGIDTNELNLAPIDLVRQRLGQPEVFVLEEPTTRGRKRQERPPELAEPEELHPAPERRAEPLAVFAVHDDLLERWPILYDASLRRVPCANDKSACCSEWKTPSRGRWSTPSMPAAAIASRRSRSRSPI